MVKIDLHKPEVQAKVKAAGIRWTLREYDNGLDIPADKARELGITAAQLKKEAAAVEKAEAKAERDAAKEEKFVAEKAEEARVEAKATADKAAKEAKATAEAAAEAAALPVRIVHEPKKPAK